MIGGLVGCNAVNDDFDDEENTVTPEDKYYLLTFNNSDKSFLFSSYVKEGDYSIESVYKGNLPTKADDSLYTYTFNGWENESTRYEHSQVIHVNKDYSFTALYTSNLIIYHTVKFVNWDDEVLYEQKVKDGEDATYVGDVPTRPNSEGNEYTFTGWNKDTTNIIEDTEIVAVYSSQRERYRVRYLNYDGTILDIQYVYYGDGVQYTGSIPTRPAEGEYEYTFSGWDKEGSMITGDVDFTAQYESSYRTLVVTFVNYDGSKLYETTTNYGGSVEYDSELQDPTRPPEGRNAYEFSGWNVPLDKIYANIEVKAQYNTVERGATQGLSFDFDYDLSGYFVSGYTGTDTDVYIPKTYNGSSGETQVKGIGANAFQNNTTITSVFVEDNVTYINDYAFAYCYSLKTLRLPQKLRSLGSYVFAQTAIENLTLPSTLESITDTTFYDYQYADKVATDPKNIYLCIDDTFIYNKDKTTLQGTIVPSEYYQNHTTVTIPEGVEEIAANAFYQNYYITEVVLPSTLITISDHAFYYCYNIQKVNFEDATSLTTIDQYAFYNCYGIKEVSFKNSTSLKTIGEYAFYNCDSIEEIEFPKSLESVGYEAFADIANLKSLTFDDCSVNFNTYCFAWCYNLETIDFGNSIKMIQSYAFYDCDKVKTVELPTSLESIEYDSFWDCNSLESISIDSSNEYYYEMDGVLMRKADDTIQLYPRGKTGTFKISADYSGTINHNWGTYYCTSLEVDKDNPNYSSEDGIIYSKDKTQLIFGALCGKNVSVPSSVTSIQEYAFYNSSSLETIDLSKANINSLPAYCFYNCDSLKEIDIPSNITSLGNYCYQSCNGDYLTTLSVPNLVTSLGEGCFSGMDRITKATLGTGITAIPRYCFSGCTQLKDITFNGSVTSLEYESFYNCGFTSFTMPNSVTTVYSYCFESCGSLETINLSTSLTSLGSSCFRYCNHLSEITLPDSLTTLGDSVFYSCTALSAITIPNSVTSMGTSCFYNCTSLQTAKIGTGLSTLCTNTFRSCSSLKDVQIGSNISTIESYCFAYCSSLAEITFPANVTTIYSRAFEACESLRNVYIPSTVTSIGNYCFSGCSNLVLFCAASSYESYYWSYGIRSSYMSVKGGYVSEDDLVYTLSNDNHVNVVNYYGGHNSVTVLSKVAINGVERSVEGVRELFSMMCPNLIVIEEGITSISSYFLSENSASSNCDLVLPKSIESIATNAGLGWTKGVYYHGSKTEFDNAGWGSYFAAYFPTAKVYYYNETIPTSEADGKEQWRYVNGVPTVWNTYATN